MTITFLPHTVIDAIEALGSYPERGISSLIALRDRALVDGAQVLLLIWPDKEWVMLAIEPPPDVVVTDPLQLIPALKENPDALQKMRQRAQKGRHLQWLQLLRPAPTRH